ncbi:MULTISPECIES: hypothetical protein [Subtercola]|uniref:Uncharacterized protein n=1 Tax=Subtercola vilae TaxID=2056433 RepID=A0A4T2BWK4_9MICO|nr:MULTISPECIES: hypothetical protein [Subtercola]MEA9985297.1 hypothetical protein [Subtercola sp. RTI3]TIH35619.1 hypothetical protein D4765_10480 [Subtercola vilae]
MPLIALRPFSVSLHWCLPEALWHEAQVELHDTRSPSGASIVSWSIDGETHSTLQPVVRLRVERHDGPRNVTVTITDTGGESWSTVFRSAGRGLV